MPQPTRSDVHVDRPLTNISVAFMQDNADYVASRVFPMVPVSKQSDQYFVYDKKQWFRSDARKRAPATESAGTGYGLSTDNYFCDVWAIHKDLDDQIRANADVPINMDRDATELTTKHCLIRKEKEWVTKYFGTGLWAGPDFTPATLWSTSGSTPIADVRAQKRIVFNATGRMPNKLVVTADVDDVLKDHADIVERIKFTQFAEVDDQIIARLFGIDEYLVLNSLEDTTEENVAGTETLAQLATKQALLVHTPANPGIMVPAAGYTFAWTGLFGSAAGTRMSRFRMDKLRADRIECEMAWDLKLVSPELGKFMDGVIV